MHSAADSRAPRQLRLHRSAPHARWRSAAGTATPAWTAWAYQWAWPRRNGAFARSIAT